MQHLDEGTIHSWLEGAFGADEAARAGAHVAECPQCAAAVAEARGFIAASSRILTALDHLPRVVVPMPPPVKWHNRAMWRAAAAVLVVAVGSLVVARSSDYITRAASGTTDSARVSETAVTQPEAVTPLPKATAAPSKIRGAVGATPQPAAPSRMAEVTALDAATEQLPLKVVGTPRMIGAQVTLYEVAPGDTVTLTELTSVQLHPVVTTGISTAEPRVAKSAAVASTQRADAAALSAPDSRRDAGAAGAAGVAGVAGVAGAPSPAPRAPMPAGQAAVANGVTTIRWADTITGNLLKLSGRMPAAQLQQIKLRIERERAAAAKKRR